MTHRNFTAVKHEGVAPGTLSEIDNKQINYRGSRPFKELTGLAPALRQEVLNASPRKQMYLEAIHLDKYNKSYDKMFETLAYLASEIISCNSMDNTDHFDVSVVRAFEHHCMNPRYGYTTRVISKERPQLLIRCQLFLETIDGNESGSSRVLREGPTWWQINSA